MKHEKEFYKNLPQINGFKWAFYDNGLHCFIKRIERDFSPLWVSVHLSEKDIETNLDYMLSNGLSRKMDFPKMGK